MGAAPLKTVHTVLIHIVSLATAVLGIYSHKIKNMLAQNLSTTVDRNINYDDKNWKLTQMSVNE